MPDPLAQHLACPSLTRPEPTPYMTEDQLQDMYGPWLANLLSPSCKYNS